MKYWLDCEFNEFGGQLISLALVDENEAYFYVILPCPNPGPWVAEHVMPVLGRASVWPEDFKTALQHYLNRYPTAHVIVDWPDDIKYMCEAMITRPGEMIATPGMVFELCRNLNSEGSAIPHNALEDARAIRRMDLGLPR